ncbi:molybdenum cofactor sulfurase isoform X2 [Ischnura elegans]|uniref:molybdenum cofactor sulfurase isoform X2 n=1 Tax=Ischnura elegans TaxID=197161 RepID=UPI001ED8BEB5|nr:molybdenum cofactor sulfurase isoform X2 [Ischnura elegans]
MASASSSYVENYPDKVLRCLSKEFGRLKGVVYLDHTAATLYAETQIKWVHDDLLRNIYGNPHSLSSSSKLAHDAIELVRYRILNHFHNPDEYSVVFTSGATAALKLVVESFDWKGSNNMTNLGGEGTAKAAPEDKITNPESEVLKESKSAGNFVYFNESHTSVIGMREVAEFNGASSKSISNSELQKCFSSTSCDPVTSVSSNSLFVYPAQCNFSGVKYPLEWTELTKTGALNCLFPGKPTNWFCFLDAATYVSTNDLNLSEVKPDFVCISFYKIFGYPTGLGALLVKKSSGHVLRKRYFGGGSVLLTMSSKKFHVDKPGLERFEDGTIPFLSILSLHYGFEMLTKLVGSMSNVTIHTFNLAKYFYESLISMRHSNGKPVAKIYCDTKYDNMLTQGNIVNFNILRANGNYVGYGVVLQMANLNKIHLRTGCFCNSGACQRHLGLCDEDILKNFEAGHICGDTMDLINGKPTGSVRISFGYMSTKEDADALLNMIKEHFLENRVEFKHFKEEEVSLDSTKGYKNKLREENSWTESNTNCTKHELSNLEKKIPENLTINKVSLSHIFLYPVKSCGAFQVERWPVGVNGLLYDRQWMIVTSNGVCVTQKIAPSICMIQPKIDLEGELLLLNYPGMQQIALPLHIDNIASIPDSSLCISKVCGKKVQVVDCGDNVAEWLTSAIQIPSLGKLRLQAQNCDSAEFATRKLKNSNLGQTRSLSNQAQFLLINYASVQWLMGKIDQGIEDSLCTEVTQSVH